ncbi:hypothetical protein LY90DRAFT_517550 [Neocallimastix californiae]|uniref:Uncharacterized protein n=1 Tax=Neocallimastix californiae TaxID=1754190 RepID=A0A1Y2A5E8_9FUNG|nr:hypothetical protein LY90DRAFT_517550 [Neocallimastix californiae]|eukprot:ORY17738.1 hypothetical protein LY90DRAFT_517550 [Neocallimastix californiae]
MNFDISEKTLKKLLIIMIVSSISSFNILGIVVSGFSFYGLKKKDISLLKIMIIPFLFDIFILASLFVICIITDVTLLQYYNSYDRKDELNKEILCLIPITIIIMVLSIFQIFIIISIRKFIKNFYLNKTKRNSYNIIKDDSKTNSISSFSSIIDINMNSTEISYPENSNLIDYSLQPAFPMENDNVNNNSNNNTYNTI